MPNTNEIHLRSEEIQEVLSSVPNWMIRWGSLVLLLIIVMIFSITYFVKYPDVITSQSRITTIVPPEKIYAKGSDKIEAILVTNGQKVTENTLLAVLKNNANYKDVLYLKSIIDTMNINNRSFAFPMDNMPILFLGDIAQNYAIFENNYLDFRINKELNPLKNEQTANDNTLVELKKRLTNLIDQKTINLKEIELQKKELQRFKILLQKGVISQQEYETKKLSLLQSQRNYRTLDTSISQIRESISTTSKDSKGLIITETKEYIKLYNNVIQSYTQLKKTLNEWESAYVLKSNTHGTVSFLNFYTVNQNVTNGDLMFSIIPEDNTKYIAKLKAPILNSGKIKIGQKVHIRLDNYPVNEYGFLKGKIHAISSIPDQNDQYLIDVMLPNKLITSYHKEIDFKQEMRGTAQVITEDLRLIERFFYKLKKITSQ